MEYYYSFSMIGTKLVAITMLLIVTTSVTVSGQSHCSLAGPVATGPCKDDYAVCVANVIAQLRDTTPYTEHMVFYTYYPADQPSGGVAGVADCDARSSFIDCRNCLFAAKDWLDQNCASFSGGFYYDVNRICAMAYNQAYFG
ncbi:hypothetical protein LINGRAHAP2_LOCUS34014 [Linum grandiflorum]